MSAEFPLVIFPSNIYCKVFIPQEPYENKGNPVLRVHLYCNTGQRYTSSAFTDLDTSNNSITA